MFAVSTFAARLAPKKRTRAQLGMLGGGGHWTLASAPIDKVPRLEPRNLFEKRASRDKSKLRAYNQILNQIHTRIYHTSQISGNQNFLTYTVPPFVLGLPSLDLEDCIVYLVHMLRQTGFVVRFTYPNLLYISWKHYEAEYNNQQNPIVQAMNNKKNSESTSKKGKEGKRGVGASSEGITFAPPMQTIGSNQAPVRSTYEYKPPDALLQSMSKPVTVTGAAAKNATANVLADLWNFR